ncbi:MAG: PAS domain-containing protein [Planctomycetes bacterium]|nr:PAS domain-containing protein [Planctomycetota bacterium]
MAEADTTTPNNAERQPAQEPNRQAQPVDGEQPPRLPFAVVGIGASAGGLEAVGEFLDAMPTDSGMALVLIQHLPPEHNSMMAEILGRRTSMPVRQVEDGMAIEANSVYVIRPGHVLTIRDGRLRLGPRLGTRRAANRPVDDFFKSLAEEQRERAIAVVLSGMGSNGTAGAQAIKAVGGLCVAQDPETAQFPSMPRHLIDAGYADQIASPADLPAILLGYASHPYASGGREADADAVLRRERQHVSEVLAVVRARTRQDFAGYKKPTVLRRIQRRMGLTRTENVGEYARLVRQTPAEATALADDLLIHVTGFFRDPDAWESLRQCAIAPLIATRESGGSVRGWVTACSSGEEAYTLARLLREEAERAGKLLDIKVFATDLAERALDHAREGVYPGGIESEITPERLERFFTPGDEVYHVRPELRDRVVFASQNILQDPPFSRIDIASCRNLLIYLEPEMQQRVLGLLHFGLREGGTLFLGSAETVAGADDLFEPIDKKSRIFRRVGPTRHGSVEFPLPHSHLSTGVEGTGGRVGIPSRPVFKRREGARPPVEYLTHRTLLDAHTPPAVTVDRDGRILYYHGDTRPFLQQLSGEPTRDLMILCQDGVRGAVRVALHQAAAQNARTTADDGWIEPEPGRRVRVSVTISPALPDPDGTGGAGDWFVVSFTERGELLKPLPPETDLGDETRRLRAELRTTIEELQTSNEELKASNEEVMSINEELQSANEELETSKEEMQSLNEELTTVNGQLRGKMDEYAAASSDLTSLLASTDIAVLFLDTAFRIRRFTPAVRDLVDLIVGDVGRPLSALARKFDDPRLDDDTRAVLERLSPIEREVAAADGRHYLRRVTPYRTTDNRIDGVVVTFVDITARLRTEAALRVSEERLRLSLESATDYAILTLDPDRVVTSWSPGAEALFGYVAAEIVGWSADRLFTPEDRAAGVPVSEIEQAKLAGRAADERWHIRKDGTRFYASGVLTPLGDLNRGCVKVLRDLTERKRAEDELRAARDELETRVMERTAELTAALESLEAEMSRRRDLAQRLVTASEAERRRVARDLHDTVGQTLTGLALAVAGVASIGQLPEAVTDRLDQVQRLADSLGRELHEVSLRLRPTALDDIGLETAVRALVEEWAQRTGVSVEFTATVDGRFPSEVETALYRVVQEALTNITKHAAASRASVVLGRRDSEAVVVIEDGGTGFDPQAVFAPTLGRRGGLGLAGMRERVTLLGGAVEIESEPGRGTTVIARIPLESGSQ